MRKSFLPALAFLLFLFSCQPYRHDTVSSKEILNSTWSSYKKIFMLPDGQVIRPEDADTVSEGQAYAMLRAVWMDDQEVFDRIYRWSEKHLSRQERHGDHLLAWKWKNGQVDDWMPASDADIDYAFALILADLRWGKSDVQNEEKYLGKARSVLTDILSKLTYRHDDGRLYLLPWILKENEINEGLPQNLSYYSPAYFRVFYHVTKDRKWLDLIDAYYILLSSLGDSFDGNKGLGLLPDWFLINPQGRYVAYKDFSAKFGWEAVRIPLKVYLDCVWFKSGPAEKYLKGKFYTFLVKELDEKNVLYSEYSYDGGLEKRYEHPLFYFSYYWLLKINSSKYEDIVLKRVRDSVIIKKNEMIYLSDQKYYENSLLWYSEAMQNDILGLKKIMEKENML